MFLLHKIHDWQKTMLEAFDPLAMKVRGPFAELCKQSLRDGKRKLEALIEVVNLLKGKDAEAIEGIRDILKKVI